MSTALSSCRRVTELEEIKRVREFATQQLPESRKFCGHLDEWLEYGFVAGDQGLVQPASPLLYVNATGEVSAVVLIIGNGSMEEVMAELHAEAKAVSGDEVAASAVAAPTADPAVADDWRNLEASYYPLICTSNTSASDALACAMLREALPLGSSRALFYFSCFPRRFRPWVGALAKECGAALEFSSTALWECEPGDFVESDRPDFREALQRCSRLYDRDQAGPASDEPPVPAHASSVAVAPAPELELAPLRMEHAELVVANWPWSSPSSLALVQHLIQRCTTRCVYVRGSAVCWSLEQSYGAMGMLHTQPQQRSRGFGPLCVEAMYRAMTARPAAARPAEQNQEEPQCRSESLSLPRPRRTVWAAITQGNAPSERVFTRRGFKPHSQVFWALWMPRTRSS